MREFRTVQGGDLITSPSSNNVPPFHYTAKWNVRRVQDKEELIPGWELWYQITPSPGDIILIAEALRPNGDQAVIAATKTHIYRFRKSTETWQVIGSGYSEHGRRWEAVNLNGYLVFNNGIDLPFSYRVEEDQVVPLFELREAGIVSVGTIWTSLGMLFLGNITEIREDRVREWLTESSLPYGPVPDHYHTKTPWRIMWSDNVHQWRLPIKATTAAGSSIITMDYPSLSFKPGDLISYTEADLSTVVDSDDRTELVTRATVIQVSGNQVQIDQSVPSSSTGFIYPANFFEQIVGFDDPETDGAVIRGYPLGERQVIFKEHSILVGTATGDAANPFIFESVYRGLDGLYLPWMVQSINDRTIIYRSRERWFSFDLINQKPALVAKLDMVRDQFSIGQINSEDCFTANNVTDREMWICMPHLTVAYNYEVDRVHLIDAAFTAAQTILHPHIQYESGIIGRAFLMAQGGKLLNYGRDYFTGDLIYSRDGDPYMGSVEFGPIMAEANQDVVLQGFRLILASSSPDNPYTVTIKSRRPPNGSLSFAIPPKYIAQPHKRSAIHLHSQSSHFVIRIDFPQPIEFVAYQANYRIVNNTLKGWM